jgi:glycosyltransferase involved in cell wall biosynthesis
VSLVNPVAWCAVATGIATIHTIVNARQLPRPAAPDQADPTDLTTGEATSQERVAVLLPVRDEAHRVEPCLRSLLAQTGVPDLRIVILDDGSTDCTADVVAAVVAGDPRVTLLTGGPLPAGWLGKPYACQQLADRAAEASVLVFIDADVVLAPHAVAATLRLLTGRDLVSPYPRITGAGAQRLVQPLLQWSWLTFLPLQVAERSPR